MISSFPTSVCHETFQNFFYCTKFHCLTKFSTKGTQKVEILLTLSHGVSLAWFSMLEMDNI